MSASTRSSRADRARRRTGTVVTRVVAAAALALSALALPSLATASHQRVDAPPLPPAVAALAQGLRAQGGGELRFLGFPIYDGWYWGQGHEWSLTSPFALDLRYHRALSGSAIAQRSVDEIARLGVATAAELKRWGEAMRGIFPDVGPGDRLTGLFVPPATVRYFANGAPIGEIVDAAFAGAFFGIWLDPRTSRPDFRAKLLGAP